MEALWKLEDKWKLSTREAVLLFVCTASLVVGLCAATALRKRVGKNRVVNQDSGSEEPSEAMWAEPEPAGWGPVKRVLMSSVRWSGASKWEERLSRSRSEGPTPLLVRDGRREAEVEWPSHNSVSPVWQRPILMGAFGGENFSEGFAIALFGLCLS
ncbi:hypothetical protein RJ639_005265 [Escallonia herrerae]|uniref:Uncharacterized protein n=1 Tax=Escallonia herrerae TaxID=1293975 RepID=A0AA88W3G3_9ASTE|nr:hypothetical protein RJ639_005265 [Escallonia herrerae]